MNKCILNFFLAIFFTVNAEAIPPENFYARRSFQNLASGAFVLQAQAAEYLQPLAFVTTTDVTSFFTAIKSRPGLYRDLQNLTSLARERLQAVLQEVHAIEIQLLGITPHLVFDDSYPRAAYFKFNTADANDPGTIILNLTDPYMMKNPYSALSLLVHETRHAAQLASARRPNEQGVDRMIAEAFLSAFRAQETLKSFTVLDFYTLTNEFEAFQFANLFIGRLTNLNVIDPSLGSYASQFAKDGSLKIDLSLLHQKPHEVIYSEFNRLEETQLNELNTQADSR